jgi:hypothetical protein
MVDERTRRPHGKGGHVVVRVAAFVGMREHDARAEAPE